MITEAKIAWNLCLYCGRSNQFERSWNFLIVFINAMEKLQGDNLKAEPMEGIIFSFFINKSLTPCTQVVNSTYIRFSEDPKDVFWRLLYVKFTFCTKAIGNNTFNTNIPTIIKLAILYFTISGNIILESDSSKLMRLQWLLALSIEKGYLLLINKTHEELIFLSGKQQPINLQPINYLVFIWQKHWLLVN